MKELEKIQPDQLNVANVASEKKKQIQLLGSNVNFPGHKTWEMNIRTGEIKEAEFVKTAKTFNAEKVPFNPYIVRQPVKNDRKTLLMKEGFLYISALNISNARKKFTQYFNHQINSYLENNTEQSPDTEAKETA